MRFTDIDVEGIVTLQLLGPGLNQLDHLMNIINEAYEVREPFYMYMYVCMDFELC